ncbi:MAG: succinylglutamate desuccinylase/aspartoacylase family protein, partial [Candidatus Competibacterales bacterium]|nr:succinylglutamate desuccinylase/aspartoacylase family protein [Candidatus Competibacterales bacterium]
MGPVELRPPDLSPWRGNTGVDYVTTLEGARPGPHLMVTALVHGNELCGALALEWLLRQGFRPRRGRLTLAFANVAAFRNFHPRAPLASRLVDEDFNRLWSSSVLDGAGVSVERRRARELRPLVERADCLLDLHSMQQPSPPLALAGATRKGVA